jgi:MmyB-like transcription regulator ligand binding domain/Helix-turn-helix domain
MSTTGSASTGAPSTGGPTDRIRRRELAAFLRSRRERITPEQVGLVRGPRRRTPGLRREEVAQLAAVGVTWYTWLEQARDIQVSPQVLDAVARALQMDANERAHLFVLAGAHDPVPTRECPNVPAGVRQVLRQLEPFPACVTNSRFDIVAHNRTYGRLVCDLDALPVEDRNLMWLSFTHPDYREALPDRDEVIRSMAAKFRASMAEHLGDPTWKSLLRRLQQESAEFREVWARHEVVQPGNRGKCYLNRLVGRMNFEATMMWLGPHQGPRLAVYTPADAETDARVRRLHRVACEEEALRAAPDPWTEFGPGTSVSWADALVETVDAGI